MSEPSSQPPCGDKAALRQWAKQVRAALADRAAQQAARAVVQIFAQVITLQKKQIVAGYWPYLTELSCVPLLEWCKAHGGDCALPVMVRRERSLFFRHWAPGVPLQSGAYGICEPLESAPIVRPDVVVVPLLAFDRAGHRLGYGHGYYDRTLGALRKQGQVLAVGLAFAGQEVEGLLPKNSHDQPLDWILTEREAHRVMS